jgi:hypothetical protein
MANVSAQRDDHFLHCWPHNSCRPCLNVSSKKYPCGWCPNSASCVPAANLLSPISKPLICPIRDERFELRTNGLGCGCSTFTFLSIVVTVFATIVALLVAWALLKGVRVAWRTFVSGSWRGTRFEFVEDGKGWEVGEWKRGSWVGSLRKAVGWKRKEGGDSKRSEQDRLTERTRLLG